MVSINCIVCINSIFVYKYRYRVNIEKYYEFMMGNMISLDKLFQVFNVWVELIGIDLDVKSFIVCMGVGLFDLIIKRMYEELQEF